MDLALAAAQIVRDQRPYEVQDGARINDQDHLRVQHFMGFHSNILRNEKVKKNEAMERAKVRCYETTPYGRRYAKNNHIDTNRFGALPAYTSEDQRAFDTHMQQAEAAFNGSAENWYKSAEIPAEEIFYQE